MSHSDIPVEIANSVLVSPEAADEAFRVPPADTPEKALRTLLAKPLRVWASESRRAVIKRKIDQAFSTGRPLTLVVPFGGYKHYWNTSAPEPDWAEVFQLEHMVRSLGPLATGLPGGVRVEYVSEDFLVGEMDNYTSEALESYAKVFRRLVVECNRRLPAGISIDFWRLSERYDTDAILRDLLDILPRQIGLFQALPREAQDLQLRRSWRSVNWQGELDLGNLSDRERRETVVRARVLELTFSEFGFTVDRIGDYYERDLNICTVFSWGKSWDNAAKQFLTLHSAKGCLVDHWIGRGVLIRRGAHIRRAIVSASQFQALELDRQYSVPVQGPFRELSNYGQIDLMVQKS